MSSFFGSTPLDPQVEAATAETLKLPDIGINMDICDTINRDKHGGANILKSIKRRLTVKSTRTVMLTLDLLEMCVKNCHRAFHAELSKKENLDAVVEVATKKNQQLDVRDKALLLIMSWAEAFHKQQDFPAYWDTYQKMLQKGVIFPARDLSTLAPVFTPPAHTQPKPASNPNAHLPTQQPQQQSSSQRNGKHPFAWLSPEYVVKTKTELQVVVNYVRVFREMLLANPSSGPQLSSDEALLSLSRTLSEIRTRLANLIVGVMEHEELLDTSIQMNDQVRICLEWYQARTQNQAYTPAPIVVPPSLAALDPSRHAEHKSDEKDDFSALATREHKQDDAFAALARSRLDPPSTSPFQSQSGERSPANKPSNDLLPLDSITLQFDPVNKPQPISPQTFDPLGSTSQPAVPPVTQPTAAASSTTDSSFFDFINATSSSSQPSNTNDNLNDFIEISDRLQNTNIQQHNAPSSSGGPSLL